MIRAFGEASLHSTYTPTAGNTGHGEAQHFGCWGCNSFLGPAFERSANLDGPSSVSTHFTFYQTAFLKPL